MYKSKGLPVGTRYGRLVVMSSAEPIKRNSGILSSSLCKCDCGTTIIVPNTALKSKNTKSCGCLHKETPTNKTHGHAGKLTPEYYSWRSMKNRCDNPNNPKYEYYGGKGVAYCKQWAKFENFLADMGSRPEGTTLDRFPKPEGNYEPSNCRWATDEEQYANKRKIIKVTLNDVTYTLRQLALAHGIPPTKVHDRWKRGKRGIDLIKPDDITLTLNIDGTARTMLELERLYVTSRALIYTRWKKGWSDYECVYGKTLTKTKQCSILSPIKCK